MEELSRHSIGMSYATTHGQDCSIFVEEEDSQWYFSNSAAYDNPRSLIECSASEFDGLLIPSSYGGLTDLVSSRFFAQRALVLFVTAFACASLIIISLPIILDSMFPREVGAILSEFFASKRPICLVGTGVGVLVSAIKSNACPFENFSVACVSAAEMASKFPVELLPLIPELRLLQLDCNVVTPRSSHPIVVIDRHLFTASHPSAAVTVAASFSQRISCAL
jgi:hypothetical protein